MENELLERTLKEDSDPSRCFSTSISSSTTPSHGAYLHELPHQNKSHQPHLAMAMATNIIRSELVKPSEATPQIPFWLSNLDLGSRNSYSPMIYFFRTRSNDSLGLADVLRKSLARALVPFYPLAGRLSMAPDGRVEIDCNAEGAVFVVAQSDTMLDDLEDFVPSKAMCDMFLPPYEKEPGAGSPLFMCQAAALRAQTGESLFRTLAAHIWRCTCMARALSPTALSRLYTMVDMRARLSPPLPDTYFGTAAVRTSVSAKVGDLVTNPLNFSAQRIRTATGQRDEYVRSLVDYLETADVRSKPGRELPDTDLRVISWMGMALHDADFGWGVPALLAPAVLSYTWFIYNIGNCGDVAVAVAMKPDHLERFKELFFDENEMAWSGVASKL